MESNSFLVKNGIILNFIPNLSSTNENAKHVACGKRDYNSNFKQDEMVDHIAPIVRTTILILVENFEPESEPPLYN